MLPDENRETTAATASAHFRWATLDTPLLELTRFVTVGKEPLGVLIDEVPRLPRLGPEEPLLPLRC